MCNKNYLYVQIIILVLLLIITYCVDTDEFLSMCSIVIILLFAINIYLTYCTMVYVTDVEDNKIWFDLLDEYRYYTDDNLEELYEYLQEIGVPENDKLLDILHNILLDYRYNQDVKKFLMTLVFIENKIQAPFNISIENLKQHKKIFDKYILSNKHLPKWMLYLYCNQTVANDIIKFRN